MINSIIKGLSKLFGNKSEKDVKALLPLVEEINGHFRDLADVSNDQLRARTDDFKARIATALQSIDSELQAIQNDIAQDPDMDIDLKEDKYKSIDSLEKDRNKELEKVLNDILPEAFAVVKETARRFKENSTIQVTASDFDRKLATRKKNPEINGNNAIFKNSWDAAGNVITWDMVHYDVQLIGGIVLHQGKVAEMGTGEGKTLVATLPAYLNALAGKGVHMVTVNDYLARRDCEWIGPLYEFHGLSVDCIDYHQPNSPQRREAYLADITFGTNNEFGFDYLRDNMARDPEDLVQRKHHFAMVDEVDSVLIDDARTPLIISGPVPKGDQQEFNALKPRIEKLVEAQKRYLNTALMEAKRLITEKKEDDAGKLLLRVHRGLPRNKAFIKYMGEPGVKNIMLKSENYHMQDQNKKMHEVDEELYFVIDEKHNSIDLSDKGIETITASGEDPHFFILPDVGNEVAALEKSGLGEEQKILAREQLMLDFSVKSERIHSINQLLKAYTLFERDIEYIIQEGKIKIVDEQTGRVLDGRRYSDGLHQAIEAKENVKVEAATQTFATVTLQNFFRMYHKLAGMTGTAETEAGELWEIYKLDVVVIPTNRSVIRKDVDDLVYKTKREKYNAAIDEIVKLSSEGRPVLVGTTSVEVSELIARMLKLRNIRHNVLNAKLHQREAEIVAEAGQAGTVTISTNMAGRGTDIKLGPNVKEAGGLAIVGTERHESRRVDRQLRGRAGRQGDPGSSQFFVSLEDDLMRLFGSGRISSIMDRFGHKEGEVIQHSMISKSIERAQKKVEQNNFGIRKRLLEYDDVMNAQREVIYSKRRNALFGNRLALDINNMLYDFCEEIVNDYHPEDYEGFRFDLMRHIAYEPHMDAHEFAKSRSEDLVNKLFEELSAHYHSKSDHIGSKAFPVIKEVFESRGENIENISVPFTDGIRNLQVLVNLKKAYTSKGREIVNGFEKSVTLALIDDEWKEHLREMDELKQSAQNAVFEQKDPLLIYKLESFKLFKGMLSRVNREVLSLLFKGHIPAQTSENVQEARQQRKPDMSKLQMKRSDSLQESKGQAAVQSAEAEPNRQPVRIGLKVGRNDPCPCGSGKKYKSCHGKDLEN